jgi:hypothetical protein
MDRFCGKGVTDFWFSNLVVEMAASRIPWMKPDDLHLDRMSFGVNDGTGSGPGSRVSGARALLGTGRAFELPDTFAPAITIAGGEGISLDHALGDK